MTKDVAEAAGWYRNAAGNDDADGQYNFARAYAYGIGIAKDPAQAVPWYQKAAEQGYAAAQFHLAYSYILGTGVAMDSVAGYQWLYLAGKQDPANKDYQTRLAALEARIRGEWMARGKALALEWLKRRG